VKKPWIARDERASARASYRTPGCCPVAVSCV